eukprot:6457704-Amphidinium_carterae.1
MTAVERDVQKPIREKSSSAQASSRRKPPQDQPKWFHHLVDRAEHAASRAAQETVAATDAASGSEAKQTLETQPDVDVEDDFEALFTELEATRNAME